MESHAAYVFCGVGALAIADSLNLIDKNELGEWL
jgi:prenyltransferase beta subunit